MSVFVVISCDDSDSDTTKPVIEVHEPEEGQALKIGSEYGVHFEMDLSDDVMLNPLVNVKRKDWLRIPLQKSNTIIFSGNCIVFSGNMPWPSLRL